MPAAWEYESAVNNVSNWYNTSADNVWNVINDYNLSPAQTQDLIPTVDSFLYGQGAQSGYTALKAADGSVLSWNNVASIQGNSANNFEQGLNSNAGTVSQQLYQLPATTSYGGTGGSFNASKGVSGGIQGATNIMSQVSAGVAAAGLGIKLGKAIDSALYNANPDFWDNAGLSSLNPETWNSITADMSNSGWEGTVKRAFNAIFGLDPNTKKSQMYIDADAAAYLAMYMHQQGVFDKAGAPQLDISQVDRSKLIFPDRDYHLELYPSGSLKLYTNSTKTSYYIYTGDGYYIILESGNYIKILFVSNIQTPCVYTFYNNGTVSPVQSNTSTFTHGGETYYSAGPPDVRKAYNDNLRFTTPSNANTPFDLGYLIYHGKITYPQTIDGITDQDGATQPDFSNCETPEDYKRALQTQYPDMFDNAITQNVAQPDGTVVQRVYIPVGTPTATGTQDPQPTTDPTDQGQSQSGTEIDPAQATQTIIETLVKYIENTRTPDTPDTTNPPDTGDGSTPPVIPPTGSGSALWTVYNPTQAQLNSFGAWLWSSNFIDQLLKLFNDPMQAIIGIHKIFATPAVSGTNNIVVGYLDSGVSSNVVGAQYTTIDCGSVNVREQFGNVFDYEDTNIRLYLPFIGIAALDTSDVMRGSVHVVYHVDVITGACLAEVRITRDGGGGTLYQYAGDAAVRYPISSGSYMGVVSGVLGVVGGIASGIMSGGATLPMAAGAIAGGMSGAKTQVQHSGSFAGNAGAMGAKKPYLIIERPQTAVAEEYGKYQGKGANRVASVGDMSGYFKMTDVHTASIVGASEAEIASIVQALESGVIA